MNFSTMTEDQAVEYYNKHSPAWRKTLTRFTGFLRMMYGQVFKAFASVHVHEMSNNDNVVLNSDDEINVVSFDGPQLAKIKRFIEELDVHNDLHNLAEYVKRLEELGQRNPKLQKIYADSNRLYKNLQTAYTQSLKAAQEIAHDSIPDNVGSIFTSVQKSLKKFGNFPSYIIVGVENDVIDFVQTTDVSTMVREDSHQETLSVVVTCRLNPTDSEFALRTFVNVSDRLALPFRYNLGTGVDSTLFKKNFEKVVKRELALHHVVAFAAPEPMKIDPVEVEKALTSIEGVTSVSFTENAIEFIIPDRNRSTVGQVIRKLRTFKEISKMEKSGHHVNVTDPANDGRFKFVMVRKL